MAFRFQCEHCQAVLTGSDRLVGRRVRCPECDAMTEANEPPPGTVIPTAGENDQTVLLDVADGENGGSDEVRVSAVSSPPRSAAGPPAPSRAEGSVDSSGLAAITVDPPPERLQLKTRFAESETDMTPMVDVTFLLLIFFMVTATFTMQKSLEVPKPTDDAPTENVRQDPDEQSEFVTVRVDEYNTFHVVTVDWEEEAPSEQDLYILLSQARDGDSTGTVPAVMRVEAHGDSQHARVVAAVDAGTASGFEEVQLATIEDD